jgi:PAS domain S-box-containing protein
VSGEHDVRNLSDLRPGDHLCCLYETEEEHRALVTPYILQGLERGEKVVYIVDAHTFKEILEYLESDHNNVQTCLDSGQLSILTRDDSYMREGIFDPDGMISMLRSETDLAIEQGYACLRVTGEMTWALRGLPGSERLIEYEAKLNEFFPGSLCMAICQYDRRRFPPEILLDVLTTHPIAVVGSRIYRNPYFMPTEEFLRADRAAATLAQWLRNLEGRYIEDEALRESEEALQIIFDSMPGLLFFKDKNNILLRINKTLCDALGMPAEEIEGRTLSDLFPNQSEDYWKDDLEVFESGKPKLAIQEAMETPQGIRWLQTDKIPYRNRDGEVEGIIGFSIDITARKRTEEALRESEEKYRLIVENAQEGIWTIDREAVTIYANQRMADMLGYGIEELMGRSLYDFMDEEERKIAEYNMERRSQGIKEQHDFEFMRKDGSRIYASLETSPILDEGGNFIAAMALVADITERRQAEEALREATEEIQSIYDGMGDGVMVLDLETGTILRTNPALASMLGYSDEELVGMNISRVHPPEELSRVSSELRKGMQGEKNRIQDLACLRKDGSTLLADITGMNISYQNRPCGVAIFRDVTERKRAEAELERINNELEAYASVVSHDLRGPITVVTSASSTIEELMARCRDKQAVDQVMEVAAMIKRSSLNAQALIDNLLNLARAGQAPSRVSEIAVTEIVQKVLEEKAVPIEENNMKITADDNLGSIMADPTHIYQLFTNLIGNAIAHNDNPCPEIRVTHQEEGGAHRYRVKDNGSGIPPDDAEKLFLPLYRGKEGDTGLGLAIVKKIVNIYGGDVRAYNDGGACFEFTIKDFPPED